MPDNENMPETLTANIARSASHSLIKAAEAAVTDGVIIPADREIVFGPLYSWWRLVCRTSELVLLAEERGFTSETGPLVRNVFNHTYAMQWLVDNGELAVYALLEVGDEVAEKLCKKMEDTGWVNAAKYRALRDEAGKAPRSDYSEAERAQIDRFKHELGNVHDLLDGYGSADLYPVYSHLSSLSHTSDLTAKLYLEWPVGTTTPQIRLRAPESGDAFVIHTALALLQTASIVSPLIEGDPMQKAIGQAAADLGLEGAQLLPERVVKAVKTNSRRGRRKR
ncbi:DUF5677 domain-containing protein [Streptomyces sp. NPDC056503]|uniref:DUF5677 domain-containing protein n=1 Tax=Streptomyces sp. NPDC056503 TaxID=3345842 RepID=UPI0036B42629